MQIDLDPRGRKIVIFGDPVGARQAVRRFLAAGGTVILVGEGPPPDWADRLDTVRYASRPLRTDTAGLLRLVGPAWLVVDVGLPTGVRDRVCELAGHLHVLMVTEEPAPRQGQVTLVGGGPGPTRLLTLEACAALRQADVVFFDRSAPTAELTELAGGAQLVDVGTTLFSDELVSRARGGESVVRLKGGDPFVFGRGGEELRACVQAGVPVRVVPGLSSALAAPSFGASVEPTEARAS